jgi:mitogen-activated protein kinase 15
LKFSGSRRLSAEQALRHPYLKDFFRESDLRCYKGDIVLETDDNIKLTTEAYRDLITKHFIDKKEQPQRFSDLKRGDKSFGKMLGELNSRKSSG